MIGIFPRAATPSMIKGVLKDCAILAISLMGRMDPISLLTKERTIADVWMFSFSFNSSVEKMPFLSTWR